MNIETPNLEKAANPPHKPRGRTAATADSSHFTGSAGAPPASFYSLRPELPPRARPHQPRQTRQITPNRHNSPSAICAVSPSITQYHQKSPRMAFTRQWVSLRPLWRRIDCRLAPGRSRPGCPVAPEPHQWKIASINPFFTSPPRLSHQPPSRTLAPAHPAGHTRPHDSAFAEVGVSPGSARLYLNT
jgi:hypothetical protein